MQIAGSGERGVGVQRRGVVSREVCIWKLVHKQWIQNSEYYSVFIGISGHWERGLISYTGIQKKKAKAIIVFPSVVNDRCGPNEIRVWPLYVSSGN